MTFLVCLFSLLMAAPFGNSIEPVNSSYRVETVSPQTIRIIFDLKIANGWHVYSTALPSGGPISASIDYDTISGVTPIIDLSFTGEEIEQEDPMFNILVRFFKKRVTFYQDLQITSPNDYLLEGAFTYGACNDKSCLPPQRVEFSFSPHIITDAEIDQPQTDGLQEIEGYDSELWAPVSYISEYTAHDDRSLFGLFLTSFIGGLIALLTPCVWPIIPMTVSFFIKRTSERRSSITDALIFGLSIISVYVALGLAITLIFGANALNALSTNALVNILFFLILVAFALSFFGLFEITLPSKWSTNTDRKSSAAGIGGIFFMALTLTIVSFSCTGPIIGFLLVDAASSGQVFAPIIGMLGFSTALAIPFTLFAMFPKWLQSMPKSGGWMDKVKVTLGCIELAFSLKFLSVADMAYGWGILPRDLFILLWIVIAVALGLYLIGIKNLKQRFLQGKINSIGCTVGIISLAFAVWMIPGLWGAPLKAISAFTPPMTTQKITHNSQAVEPQFTDFNSAIQESAKSGKPILIDFTGYGCVNCRKMEATVWTDERVSQAIRDKYILLSLFVDDKTPLSKSVTISENSSKTKIRTVGDKWSLLQRHKFGANAQPFYVIIDSMGKLIAGPYTFNPSADSFLTFLNSAD